MKNLKELEARIERLEKELAELKRENETLKHAAAVHHHHYYPQPVYQPQPLQWPYGQTWIGDPLSPFKITCEPFSSVMEQRVDEAIVLGGDDKSLADCKRFDGTFTPFGLVVYKEN